MRIELNRDAAFAVAMIALVSMPICVLGFVTYAETHTPCDCTDLQTTEKADDHRQNTDHQPVKP